MSDSKDDGSSEENEELSKRNQKRRAGEPLIRERDMEIEERRRSNKARLEGALTPQGVQGVRLGPTKFPAPPVDYNKWARLELWEDAEWPALLLGFGPHHFEPYDTTPGIEDYRNILWTARTSIKAGRLRKSETPRLVLAWVREKEFPIPEELEEAVNRFHPGTKDRPPGAADRPKWPWGSHETKLLQDLAGAANKFWKLYDPSDPTTGPTNREVIDWLIEQGVAKRTAEIIATILRADGLPHGPRK